VRDIISSGVRQQDHKSGCGKIWVNPNYLVVFFTVATPRVPTLTRCCQRTNIANKSLANALPPTPRKCQRARAERCKQSKCHCPTPNFALRKPRRKPSEVSFAAPPHLRPGLQAPSVSRWLLPPPIFALGRKHRLNPMGAKRSKPSEAS
jgi:hypothetical protein